MIKDVSAVIDSVTHNNAVDTRSPAEEASRFKVKDQLCLHRG